VRAGSCTPATPRPVHCRPPMTTRQAYVVDPTLSTQDHVQRPGATVQTELCPCYSLSIRHPVLAMEQVEEANRSPTSCTSASRWGTNLRRLSGRIQVVVATAQSGGGRMGRPRGWAAAARGRAPMRSPAGPPAARREHRQPFCAPDGHYVFRGPALVAVARKFVSPEIMISARPAGPGDHRQRRVPADERPRGRPAARRSASVTSALRRGVRVC
jgi:hypothetical protein